MSTPITEVLIFFGLHVITRLTSLNILRKNWHIKTKYHRVMKDCLITFLLTILAMPFAFGQQLSPQNKAKQETYLEISHRQKKTGAIILGVGAATTLIGIVSYSPSSTDPFDIGGSDFSYAATSIGIVAMISSVPFFISSGANKRRAYQLSFDLNQQPLINSEITGLVLKPQQGIRLIVKF